MTAAAIVECLVRDTTIGKSVRTLDGVAYVFSPSPSYDGAWVATVTKPAHIARFLAITEGYRLIEMIGGAAPQELDDTVPGALPTQQPSPGPLADSLNVDTTPPLPAAAPAAPDTQEQEPASTEEAEEPAVEADRTTPPPDEPPTTDITEEYLDGLSDDAVKKVFEKVLGRKPNGRSSRATIIHQILTAGA